VIYYMVSEEMPILALLIYGKNEQVNPTPEQTRAMAAVVRGRRVRGGNHETEIERMATEPTDITDELIASMQEAAAIVRGQAEPPRIHLPPDVPDVRAIRERLGLSRPAFAERFGLAVSAVRDWEQGLRRPDPAARVLLMVIGRSPEVVAQAVAEGRAA